MGPHSLFGQPASAFDHLQGETANFAMKAHSQLVVHQDLQGLFCKRQGEQLFYQVQCFRKENHHVVLLDALFLQ